MSSRSSTAPTSAPLDARSGTPRRARARLTVGVAAALCFAAGVAPTAAQAQVDVSAGKGSAYAQGVKVDPQSGRLSFGITYGMALVGHQNNVAQAESRSADLGVLGTTLGGEGCDGGEPTLAKEDQPQPLRVRSGDDGAATGISTAENGVERSVLATTEPYARAVAVTAGQENPLFSFGGTTSESITGIIDGKRQAIARTTVGDMSLAAGQVVIEGMEWEARHISAPEESLTATFRIEGLTVAGTPVPIDQDNPTAQLASLDTVLSLVGIELVPPTITQEEGRVSVSPMRIGFVPNPTCDQVAGTILGVIQPVRESIFDMLIEADCGNASYITIADLALGSVTGAGSINFEIGGVNASSGAVNTSSFLGGGVPLPRPDVAPRTTPAPTAIAVSPRASATPAIGTDVAAVAPVPLPVVTASTPIGALTGSRGGPLAFLGLATLAGLAVMAERDRRLMRLVQRAVVET